MDNVTHTLTGLALSRAGLGRIAPGSLAVLLLSSNIPDADIIALTRNQLAYFEAHRGYTHSVVLLPLLSLLSVVVVGLIFRQRLPWTRLWILGCLGVGSHLLLDWTNSYGVRLLLPFSSQWFHRDINALYDGVILALLLFAAIWPFLSNLVSSEIGERRKPHRGVAAFALLAFVTWDLVRGAMHARALAQLNARLYDSTVPRKTDAFPQPFSLVNWQGAVDTMVADYVVPVDALGQLDVETARAFYKSVATSEIAAAKRSEAFRYFSYFARYPVWTASPVTVHGQPFTRIDLTDLRFGRPNGGSFHCVAIEDARKNLVQSWFTFGSGEALGWGDGGPPPASTAATTLH